MKGLYLPKGYQPRGDKNAALPKPPKSGSSQSYFEKNFKILSQKISDDGKFVEMVVEAKMPMDITIKGVIKL